MATETEAPVLEAQQVPVQLMQQSESLAWIWPLIILAAVAYGIFYKFQYKYTTESSKSQLGEKASSISETRAKWQEAYDQQYQKAKEEGTLPEEHKEIVPKHLETVKKEKKPLWNEEKGSDAHFRPSVSDRYKGRGKKGG